MQQEKTGKSVQNKSKKGALCINIEGGGSIFGWWGRGRVGIKF
jgi:hypothetical protein